jgi:hypothetical protein
MPAESHAARKRDELPLFVWATEVRQTGDGRAELVARKPVRDLSVKKAAEIIGCPREVVWRIFRAGLITGSKPGAIAVRKDGRGSNAALRLDAESVLRYKESRTQRGLF